MKRDGNIIEEIIEWGNLSDSFDKVLRGTKRKESRQGSWLLEHRDEVLHEMSERIGNGSFRIKDYRDIHVVEAGKPRCIQVLTMQDRIAIHAVMNVVDKHLHRRFIRTTGASIKRRGMHDLMQYIRRDMELDPEGTAYCYKFDIRKFYESIDQNTVMDCLRRVFKDKKLLTMLEGFVRMMPNGLSIGLRSSQGLGNLLLSQHLDHVLKDEMGVRHYYRYCDDGVVLAASKTELWAIRDAIHERIQSIGLEIKPNERVFPVSEGIDFLGYVIRPTHVLLRKRIKQKAARKLADIKSRRRRREVIAALYGMTKHADCHNMYLKLTGKKMKSFKDLNVSYQPEDGKKRFPGAAVSIRELVNLPIVVKDFETGIKTEQGEDRCLVSIELNGEPKKFFTNSKELKNILEQIAQMEDGFPFETVIKSEPFGKGRTKYIFT